MSVPVLLITGPVGVGKTSVLGEITHLLAERRIPHAGVNVDSLSDYFPRLPADDRFGTLMALRNLTAVWKNFHAAGAERLVVATVIETPEDLARLRAAIPESAVTVVRLRAPVAVLQDRVRQRELGAGLDWHVARAAELAAQFEALPVEHVVVDTEDRTVREIAEKVLRRVGWE